MKDPLPRPPRLEVLANPDASVRAAYEARAAGGSAGGRPEVVSSTAPEPVEQAAAA